MHQLRLPDALGVACAKARDTSEVLPRVLELRDEMASVRDAINESRRLGRSDTDIVRALRRAVPGLAFARSIDTVVTNLPSVATAAGTDLGTALLMAKLATKLSFMQRAAHVLDVIQRPHVRVLQRFSSLVESAATTDDLFRLWDMKPTREWFAAATSLSELSVFESARMTRF